MRGKQSPRPRRYGNRQLQGHRAGAGPLRQGQGLTGPRHRLDLSTVQSFTGDHHEHRHRHRRRRPHRGRQVRRHARQDPRARAGRHRHQGAAERAQARPASRSTKSSSARCCTAGTGQNPARQAVIKGGLPHARAGDDDQQGLRLGPEGRDAGGAGHPRRRQRDRHRRRPGEHEPVAARAARLARRPAHGRLEAGRHDDRRRPVGRLQPVPHGHHGRERGQEVRHHARAAGRAGAGLAAEGRGGAGSRPLQGRDRAVSASPQKKGDPIVFAADEFINQQDQRRSAGRPAPRLRQGRQRDRRQRLGPQRRRRRGGGDDARPRPRRWA